MIANWLNFNFVVGDNVCCTRTLVDFLARFSPARLGIVLILEKCVNPNVTRACQRSNTGKKTPNGPTLIRDPCVTVGVLE
jgi:hypothetical protein